VFIVLCIIFLKRASNWRATWYTYNMGRNSQQLAKTTPVTVTPVTPVNLYAKMSTGKLDGYIRTQNKKCAKQYQTFARNADELYFALAEMEQRFNKKCGARTDIKKLGVPGWHEYLESRGVKPDAFRQWKHRRALQALIQQKKAAYVAPNINVFAAEIAREFEKAGWAENLAKVAAEQNKLTPIVRARLIDAMRGAGQQLLAMAEQMDQQRLSRAA
jgi:hypothetical protein